MVGCESCPAPKYGFKHRISGRVTNMAKEQRNGGWGQLLLSSAHLTRNVLRYLPLVDVFFVVDVIRPLEA